MDVLKLLGWRRFFAELVMRRCLAAAVYGALLDRARDRAYVGARVECEAHRGRAHGSWWLPREATLYARVLATIRRTGTDIQRAHFLSGIAPTTMFSDEPPTPAPHDVRPCGMKQREGAEDA